MVELRQLPSVHAVAEELGTTHPGMRGELRSSIAREALQTARSQVLGGQKIVSVSEIAARTAQRVMRPSRRALNATGVLLHTNLGRAPIADAALRAMSAAAGYESVEFDETSGARRRRDRPIEELLTHLVGAESATVANNGAAALLLAIAAVAGPGARVAISRGQMLEIGGGFRIPDIVAQSGVELLEVGTTNRTTIQDYVDALNAGATTVLVVHQANFRAVGYASEPALDEICGLGAPVIFDLGSGLLFPRASLRDEPDVKTAVASGADIICFSGDKLLGGPQAGLLVGTKESVERCRSHPLARAVRIGRSPLAALVATLQIYAAGTESSELPLIRMLEREPDELLAAATTLAEAVGGRVSHDHPGRVGGGAAPTTLLPGPAVILQCERDEAEIFAALLDQSNTLLATIRAGNVILNPRTLLGNDLNSAIDAVRSAERSVSSRNQ